MKNLRSSLLVSITALFGWGLATACGGTDAADSRSRVDASSYDDDYYDNTSSSSSSSSGYNSYYDAGYNSNNSYSPGRVACGTTECTSQSQACCTTATGSTCIAAGETCAGGTKLVCDDMSDCPTGQKCCAGLFGIACAASCDFIFPVQLCTSSTECADGGVGVACTDKSRVNIFTGATERMRSCGAAPLGWQ